MKELTGPPIVGKRYLVPAIHYPFHDNLRWWPVIGLRHEDRELLGFDDHHYHMDWRFAPDWAVTKVTALSLRLRQQGYGVTTTTAVFGWPLCTRNAPVPLETTLKAMTCRRPIAAENLRWLQPFDVVTGFYAGHAVARGPLGLICPHRGAPLHTLEPNADGVVVCPLHGLHICTKTARVMPVPEPMMGPI